MTRYFVLIFFFALVMMSSTGQNSDSIPPKQIEAAAKRITDRQLESISRSEVSNSLIIHFQDLRDHIDSLNASNIVQRMALDSASQSRDSLTHALLLTSLENDRLRASNEQYKKDWEFVSTAPTVLFIFVLMFAASMMAQGVYNYYKTHRKSS